MKSRSVHFSMQGIVFPLVATVLLGGCSGEAERNYSVPESLCGVRIDSAVLTPFLPSGRTVRVRGSSPADGIDQCIVSVDGRGVLKVRQMWWAEGTPTENVAEANPVMSREDRRKSGEVLYTDTGAVTRVSCANPRKAEDDLFAEVQVRGEENPTEAAVKSLAAAYSQAVERVPQCNG